MLGCISYEGEAWTVVRTKTKQTVQKHSLKRKNLERKNKLHLSRGSKQKPKPKMGNKGIITLNSKLRNAIIF